MSAQPSHPTFPLHLPYAAPATRRVTVEPRNLGAPVQWVHLAPDPASGLQNFTPALVDEFKSILDAMLSTDGVPRLVSPYTVIQSTHPDYFSVGGDLAFFRDCIQRGDAETLRAYSMQCLNLMHGWSSRLSGTTCSIALVQGRALGGGFEMVLSTDYVIAECQSSFGFPEIMFGLFPCTGAMGLLARRIGARQAERMMTNKRVYSAEELLAMGLIDEVCEQGEGETAVGRFIQQHNRRRRALLKVQQSRQRHSAFDYEEGVQVVQDWVELAMSLSADELRTMEMLMMFQKTEVPAATAARIAR